MAGMLFCIQARGFGLKCLGCNHKLSKLFAHAGEFVVGYLSVFNGS